MALVIILAFLVLLVGVAIAFLSRAITERQVSNSSAGNTKADILARGGLDIILGDLNQEIVNGSVTPAPTPTPGVTIYFPKAPADAVPVRDAAVAALTGSLAIPNLIRVSGTAAPSSQSPEVETALASPGALSTGTSANGTSVNISRWNAGYMIPLSNTTGTNFDTTPVSSFASVAPSWVMVTSTGPAVITSPTSSVIGRYAYAIYDEGGLLDMNVAGYPSSISGSATLVGLKGSEAMADLTQIGLTQDQVDTLLGWRNYATIQPSTGSLSGSYNLSDAASGSNYFQYVTTASNGFLTLNPQIYSNRTDQAFNSRQDLIKLARAESWSPNALQYMATFTRDIEQPSLYPNPNRPVIVSGVAGTNQNSYKATYAGTGNDAYGLDRTGTPSKDINPPFLTVRVTTPFTRPDGSYAPVGDPVVKKRFPLSRLALLTTGATATQSQSNLIYRYFGLYRTSGTGPWLYNHGNSTGIYRLSDVAALGREPDFFELLKAAINVGSIGKASCYSSNTMFYYEMGTAGYLQDFRDNQTALQILQIGANIIDQYKADDFPTRIQFSGDPNIPPYEVRGMEDLPYLYRVHNWIMRVGSSGTQGVLLFQPELWNPNSYPGSSAGLSGTAVPSYFRVRVADDPSSNGSPFTGLSAIYNSGASTDFTSSSPFNSGTTPLPLTFNAGEINGYWGFREPTLLAQIGVPGSSHLSGTGYTDYPVFTPNPNRIMTGIFVAEFPWTSSTAAPTDVCHKVTASPNGYNSCVRYYLQYADPYGNWITYDEQPFQPFDNFTMSTWPPTTPELQEFATTDFYGGARTDPRTSRWGFIISEYLPSIPMVGTSNSNNEYCTFRPDGGMSYGSHWGPRSDIGFVQGYTQGYPSIYRGFQHGYWTENSIRNVYQTPPGTPGQRYTRDPDGVPRRAMGGYWSDTANNGNPSPPVTSGTSSTLPVIGLPMATGTGYYASRPTILHRPFRSVAELGYAFSDNPWRNLDLSYPESGFAGLMDVFCLNENTDANALAAGRVDLNTRQAPVLNAIMSGALLDKDDPTMPQLSGSQIGTLAAQLITRTSGSMPLTNRADLVGSWNPSTPISSPTAAATALASNPDPNAYYSGFSADIGTLPGIDGTPVSLIPRQRETVMRALADSGTARVWNLMIDIIAQSGRYKPGAKSVGGDFVVEGERRYWLHVAIDRDTGQILDKQLELVNE
ncbi:MAG TPA: hypothetical protein VHY22_08470 [Chthoniobacteraceae bacterium]|nr:hypothetical protein [Chthoniobacteraceae bacterium]